MVGTTSVDKSEIVSSLLDAAKIPHEVLNAKYHEQEAKIIEKAGRRGAVTVATNMAGRGADIVIGGGNRGDAAFEEIKAIGGLHVIGTERHEARRIDNQLRGRTGRQGEPGSSRFYVALDDQLMKILGGEIMTRLMNTVGLKDDMPIELKIISRQIESAQKRIEGINFDSRKRIVEYDDVMNQHREIFYSRRRNFLQSAEEASGKIVEGEVVIDLTSPMYESKRDEYKTKVEEARVNLKAIVHKLLTEEAKTFVADELSTIKKWNKESVQKLIKKYIELVPEYLLAKTLDIQSSKIIDTLSEDLLKEKQDKAEKYFVELTNKVVDQKLVEFKDDFYYLAKAITLQTMDNIWVDHLELMKDIREGIGLQAYAQKDPLVEYKNEAFVIFESFIKKINSDVTKQILSIQKVQQKEVVSAEPQFKNIETNKAEVEDIITGDREFLPPNNEPIEGEIVKASGVKASNLIRGIQKQRSFEEASVSGNLQVASQKVNAAAFKDVGRNDPCPCGSGKKFKKCHGSQN